MRLSSPCLSLLSCTRLLPSSVWRSAPPAAAALSDCQLPWELRTAQCLTDGIRARTSSTRPLDLLVDLHDAESGLSSEGVWHNAWLGVAYVQTARQLRRQGRFDEAEEPFDLAVQLADSLYENSFDEGFRRRTASGVWRSAESSASAIEAAGESIAFYSESRERRSAQNAAAVVFYSLLADEAAARESGDAPRIARLCDEVGVSFLDLFFDEEHGRFRRGALEDGPARWRAVDQAVGCLACLRLTRLDPEFSNTDTALARDAARRAVGALRDEFGYGAYASGAAPSPLNHVGDFPGARRRNSWHDGLVAFALAAHTKAEAHEEGAKASEGSMSDAVGAAVDASELLALLHAIHRDYADHGSAAGGGGDDGGDLLVHQQAMLEREPAARVHFTCTQAIWAAVGRAAGEVLPPPKAAAQAGQAAQAAQAEQAEAVRAAFAAHDEAWRAFVAARADEGGLLPVADAYPVTRLWSNTEPSAWLQVERADFKPVPRPARKATGVSFIRGRVRGAVMCTPQDDNDEVGGDGGGGDGGGDGGTLRDVAAAVQTAVRFVADAAFLLYTVVVQVGGAVLGAGLVLNLCGVGYRFVREPPFVEINTLAEMRGDNAQQRFERSAERDLNRLFPD